MGNRPQDVRARIAAGQKARWQRVHEADYRTAAVAARALMYSGETDDPLFRVAVEGALRFAPEGERGSWRRIVEALAAGRRFKVSTFPASFRQPVDPGLVAAVDAIFEQEHSA